MLRDCAVKRADPDNTGLQISRIQARFSHRIKHVQTLQPGICKVVHGVKHVWLGEQTLKVPAGHWVLLPAQMSLDIENVSDSKGYLAEVVNFSHDTLPRFSQQYSQYLPKPGCTGLQAWCLGPDSHLEEAWQRLCNSLQADEAAVLQQHLLWEVLLLLGLKNQIAPLLVQTSQSLAMRVQQLLLLNPSEHWSLEQVSRHFHMSNATLRRHLSAEGQSFRNILHDVRMTYALGFLQTTNRAIGEIAYTSGYASASRFAVRFRSRFGLTPRALRKAL